MEWVIIEYEPDTVPPQASTAYPNGGEVLEPGDDVNIRWNASDNFGSVTGVDIHLSRSGPQGPFEPIALGLSNTGAFVWSVTGPLTTQAYLRVTVRDTGGNTVSDLSDAAFSIDQVVAVEKTTWGAIKALYR